MRRKKTTMQDIADRLNISKVTVSKALNGKDGVGKELKKRILETGKAMGYDMPGAAGNPEEAGNVVILVKEKFVDREAGFYLKIYQRISPLLSAKGYLAQLVPVGRKESASELAARIARYPHIEGMILLGDMGTEFFKGVEVKGLPCIQVDFYNSTMDIDCIVTENIYSTCKLTGHLMENGHRNIGFLGTVGATNSIKDRFLGYCKAHIDAGIPVHNEWILDDRDQEGEFKQTFSFPEQMPTAFVCNCDDAAYRFIKALKERGVRVPEDISVVSFDNDIYAELCEPKLTTVAVDFSRMASMAVDLICTKIENPKAKRQEIAFVSPKIICRDSVSAAEPVSNLNVKQIDK